MLTTEFKEQAPPVLCKSIIELLRDSGMQALAEDSALTTYLAAGRRKFTNPPDAIYGIQQIFNARVGITAAGADHRKVWSLEQLEIQLGSHLLYEHPVLSQMHVFTAPATLGSAWLVSRTKSIIPPNQRFVLFTKTRAARDHNPDDPVEVSRCTLSIKWMKGTVWCRFDGPCCAFVEFHKVVSQLSCHEVLKGQIIDANLVTIYLDVTPELSKCPEYQKTGYTIVPRGKRQDGLAQWLTEAFAANTLRVLLLGRRGRTGQINEPTVFVGLLLLQRQGKNSSQPSLYHRRIGICVWSSGHLTVGGFYLPNAKLMTGIAPLWKREIGIFG
ncbi:hypothetical protein F4808DRAFT_401805 [Astrocystis sublimbata]|nr:hypothetical protein F4808DRAFT_401795 [Astrocystis sublimbata]KAI0190580.1 hypothetical protein F4808DRAFT_401805 [Astrocystis sublimbata]